MRPVIRGACPTHDDGTPIVFKAYPMARRKLMDRIDECCSYCEMHLDSSLAVEHVQPKKPPGSSTNDLSRELNWDNFLLACTNCNSTKGNTDVVIDDYVWPDRDNTFLAIIYKYGGLVEPAPGAYQLKAQRTIKLVGLDSKPSRHEDETEASDRRWNNRREAWDIAVESKNNLAALDHPLMRAQIVLQIKDYWSVWMTVFADDPDMKRRILDRMLGTAVHCFDATNDYAPIPRSSP